MRFLIGVAEIILEKSITIQIPIFQSHSAVEKMLQTLKSLSLFTGEGSKKSFGSWSFSLVGQAWDRPQRFCSLRAASLNKRVRLCAPDFTSPCSPLHPRQEQPCWAELSLGTCSWSHHHALPSAPMLFPPPGPPLPEYLWYLWSTPAKGKLSTCVSALYPGFLQELLPLRTVAELRWQRRNHTGHHADALHRPAHLPGQMMGGVLMALSYSLMAHKHEMFPAMSPHNMVRVQSHYSS